MCFDRKFSICADSSVRFDNVIDGRESSLRDRRPLGFITNFRQLGWAREAPSAARCHPSAPGPGALLQPAIEQWAHPKRRMTASISSWAGGIMSGVQPDGTNTESEALDDCLLVKTAWPLPRCQVKATVTAFVSHRDGRLLGRGHIRVQAIWEPPVSGPKSAAVKLREIVITHRSLCIDGLNTWRDVHQFALVRQSPSFERIHISK
jgi:hypothetical protein